MQTLLELYSYSLDDSLAHQLRLESEHEQIRNDVYVHLSNWDITILKESTFPRCMEVVSKNNQTITAVTSAADGELYLITNVQLIKASLRKFHRAWTNFNSADNLDSLNTNKFPIKGHNLELVGKNTI